MDEPKYQHLTSETRGDILILTVTDERVQGDEVAEAMQAEMLDAQARAQARHVVVCFKRTKYISSTAFRPLLSLRRRLQEHGGRIVLCGLNSVVGDIFRTTRMVADSGDVKAIFDMEPDTDAALARLAAVTS